MRREIQRVYMAREEWGSQQEGMIMHNIAAEILRGEDPPAVCEVNEHGGWWLSYALLNGEPVIVGTANDQWKPPADIRTFWAQHQDLGFAPCIRRGESTP